VLWLVSPTIQHQRHLELAIEQAKNCCVKQEMKMQTPHGRLLLAFFLAALIQYGFTFVPHFAESVKEMKVFAHTTRGFAIMMGAVFVFTGISSFIFVDLWH
jgi:hypothetical protein